jgi:hypothetical protein
MIARGQSISRAGLGAFLALVLLSYAPARAAPPDFALPTIADLKAVSKAIGFVEGQPRFGGTRIGIVHLPDPVAETEARKVAELLATIEGPRSTVLVPVLLSTSGPTSDEPLNALFVMPSAAKTALKTMAHLNARQIPTISTNAECLSNRTCMLFVRAEPRVTIVLDTALADAAAIRFSPIFIMMVKRQ